MTTWEAIFLGIIQGLTEFLPVSSSGHLVISQYILGVKQSGITFEVFVHFGTLVSIIWVFYADIKKLILAALNINYDPLSRRMIFLLIMGCIPTAIMGIVFEPFFVGLFDSVVTVGFMLLVTGSLLWIINWKIPGAKKIGEMKTLDAIIVGIFQGMAIIPGVSRSGATIFAALLKDLDRATAIRYSFLLALPAILGATLLEARELMAGTGENISLVPLVLGTVAALFSGILAIKTFIKLLQMGRLYYFSYYCWMVGSLIILWQLVKKFGYF